MFSFFFQAEDGIRDGLVTGVQTCALPILAEVLEIDPEDRVAHYNRMLALRALGREAEADRAEAAYLYYGIDESAQEITRAYRARDPGANIMAQPIPTHRLEIRR